MRRAASTLSGRQTQRTIAAPMSRRTMMKTVGYLMAMRPTLIAQRWVINGIMRGSIK